MVYRYRSGGELEYLYLRPETRRRLRKGNPLFRGHKWATLSVRNINAERLSLPGWVFGRRADDLSM
jgi:hypothetical protein